MSLWEYKKSQELPAYSFLTLLFAAMRKADGYNLHRLREAFPDEYEEFVRRYNAPGGKLEGEE